ncbi:MAG: hypothetical protein ABFD49_11220 [Armatimonadota bacterium]|nr:hypothetical protein [bacterium]
MNETKIIDNKLCLSSSAMEEVFGITRAALSKWTQQGCPKAKHGWWPLADVITWRGLGSKGSKNKDDGELTDLQLKLKYDAEWKRLQAEGLEITNAVKRGDYRFKIDVITEWNTYLVTLKKSLQALSRKIATDISPFVDPPTARRIEREMADMITMALETMSSGENYVAPKRRVIKG